MIKTSKNKITFSKTSLLNREPHVPACQRGLRANVLTCQRDLRANVPACHHAKSVPTFHFYVPACHTACQCFNLACQRDKWRANISTWRANVPKGVPIFQVFLLRNAKWNFYTLSLYRKFYILLDIIVVNIIRICVVNKNLLYFTSVLHVILKKSVRNFFFFLVIVFFFCSLVRN